MIKFFRKKSVLLSFLMIIAFSMTILAGCGGQPPKEEPKKEPAPKVEEKKEAKYVPISERGYANPDVLIDTEGLKKIMKEPNVRIIDVRGNAKYILGHIPGAINPKDFRDSYSNNDPIEGMFGTKAQVEKMFSDMGVTQDTHIVLYDESGDYDAARLYWQTKMIYGHKGKIQMLDGGLKKWKIDKGETEMSTPSITPTKYVANEPKTEKPYYAKIDEVKAQVEKKDPNVVILDTRAKTEFTGEELKKGAFDKGRIPGAVFLEYKNALNKDDDTFLPAAELKKIYEAKGVTPNKRILGYCQSGVRSAHTWFVLTELLGYKDVANYDGSWIEWSIQTKDGKLPKESGEEKK